MTTASTAPPLSAREAAELLMDARERTLLLIGPVSEEDLRAQHSPLMGPILWDLGHIAHFEELWLIDNLEGPVEFGEMPGNGQTEARAFHFRRLRFGSIKRVENELLILRGDPGSRIFHLNDHLALRRSNRGPDKTRPRELDGV